MSIGTKSLEDVANNYVAFDQYLSSAGQKNIQFDYELGLREHLLPIILLESCFYMIYVGFSEVCSTTRRCQVLVGMKIIHKNTKHHVTKDDMFKYEPIVDSDEGGGVFVNERITCAPLCCVLGDESNKVYF